MARDPIITVATTSDGRVSVMYEVYDRPWTTNAERAGNRYKRAADTKRWRELFAVLTMSKRPAMVTDAIIDVKLQLTRTLQDTASCNPAVKAAIDGMVDGGLFIDDTGDHVKAITFNAPQRGKENKITITVEGKPHGTPRQL